VLLATPGTDLDPTLLSVLLAGLDGDPLVNAATLAQVFDDVPLATSPDSGAPGGRLVRRLEGAQFAMPLQGAAQLPSASRLVSADAEIYGASSVLVRSLDVELVAVLSSTFSPTQRAAMIASAFATASAALNKLRLPPSEPITLTSRQGLLPLAVLSSDGTSAHVLLVLRSEQLSFVAVHLREGWCRLVNVGSEECQLTLDHAVTTLQLKVAARTSGAFPLTLELETPSGSRVIATSTDTVRSTAISDVGLVLMVGAALFLAVWWARNARHGRRAKKLVPRFAEDDGAPVDVPVARARDTAIGRPSG
jgi:hypothetical protein